MKVELKVFLLLYFCCFVFFSFHLHANMNVLVFDCGIWMCVRQQSKAKQSPSRSATKKTIKAATTCDMLYFILLFARRNMYIIFVSWVRKEKKIINIYIYINLYLSVNRENGFVVCQFCRDILQINQRLF